MFQFWPYLAQCYFFNWKFFTKLLVETQGEMCWAFGWEDAKYICTPTIGMYIIKEKFKKTREPPGVWGARWTPFPAWICAGVPFASLSRSDTPSSAGRTRRPTDPPPPPSVRRRHRTHRPRGSRRTAHFCSAKKSGRQERRRWTDDEQL